MLLIVMLGVVTLIAARGLGDDPSLLRLSIIHFNDFHARFDETSFSSALCHNPATCVGGFSRLFSAIRSLVDERPNTLVLNAGDVFQGTLWYTIYRWNVTAHFMNMIPQDASTLGNHEFDDSISGLLPYLERVRVPVLVANVDCSREPELGALLRKSIVVERQGRKIGVIGYVMRTLADISNTDALRFTDEVEAVGAEARRLASQGVDILIALSHAGVDVDQRVAALVPELDLVVGGHSHTLLYSGTPPRGDLSEGPYPLVVKQAGGRLVLIVQAFAFSKYLGDLVVTFDSHGEVVDWEGNPLLLDTTMVQDVRVLAELKRWRNTITRLGSKVIGRTRVLLDGSHKVCKKGECILGSLIADAMVEEYVNITTPGTWTHSIVAIVNSGGIRSSIVGNSQGDVTYEELAATQPFGNTIDIGELKGSHLLLVLEQAVAKPYTTWSPGQRFLGFLQVSGMRVTYNVSRPVGARVQEVTLRCADCPVPRYVALEANCWYRVLVPSFLVRGGDGYRVITENLRNHVRGRVDIEVLMDYMKKHNPIVQRLDGRIKIVE